MIDNSEMIVSIAREINNKLSGGTPSLEQKTITANGTYTPSSGYQGFSSVTVNVPSTTIKEVTLNSGGEPVDWPEEWDSYTGEVTANEPVKCIQDWGYRYGAFVCNDAGSGTAWHLSIIYSTGDPNMWTRYTTTLGVWPDEWTHVL